MASGQDPLHHVVVHGTVEAAREAIAADPDAVHSLTPLKMTPLMEAAHRGRVDMVELLLQHGAECNKADKGGWTALMYAASEGTRECVAALVQAGADIHAVSKIGYNALMYAASEGKEDTLALLLAAGSDTRGSGLVTAQELAVRNEHFNCARMLGVTPGDDGDADLHGADTTSPLLERSGDDNDGGGDHLVTPASSMQGTSEEGADSAAPPAPLSAQPPPAARGTSRRVTAPPPPVPGAAAGGDGGAAASAATAEVAAAHAAATDGDTGGDAADEVPHFGPRMSAVNLEELPDAPDDNVVPDHVSYVSDADSVATPPPQVLAAAHAGGAPPVAGPDAAASAARDWRLAVAVRDFDPLVWRGWTPLVNAAAMGNIRDISKLSRLPDFDVNALAEHKWTALMWAADAGRAKAVLKLLSLHAKVNLRTDRGWTALMFASARGFAPIVRMLCEAGARVNGSDLRGVTPLMLAAGGNHASTMKALIAAGAQVNKASFLGLTPLMGAVAYEAVEAVVLLINNGADVRAIATAGPNAGKSAARLAYDRQHAVIMDLIRQADPTVLDEISTGLAEAEAAKALAQHNSVVARSKRCFAALWRRVRRQRDPDAEDNDEADGVPRKLFSDVPSDEDDDADVHDIDAVDGGGSGGDAVADGTTTTDVDSGAADGGAAAHDAPRGRRLSVKQTAALNATDEQTPFVNPMLTGRATPPPATAASEPSS